VFSVRSAVTMSVQLFDQATESADSQQPVLSMREAAKWITTAFAAVGAALVASLQLSGLGQLDLDDPNLWWAAIGFGVAMVFVGVAIFYSTKVLFSPYITFADLTEAHSRAVAEAGRRRKHPQEKLRPWRFDVLLEAIDRDKPDLYEAAATDLGELGEKYSRALQDLATHEAGGVLRNEQGRQLDDEAAKQALTKARLTLEAVDRTVDYANNFTTRRNLDRLLNYVKWAGLECQSPEAGRCDLADPDGCHAQRPWQAALRWQARTCLQSDRRGSDGRRR
jgi:hypothetical protein